MRRLLSAAFVPGLLLLLASCASGPDKGVVARVTAGAELVQAGQAVRQAAELARATGGDAAALDADADRLTRDGRTLESGVPVKDPGATLDGALPGLRALATRAAAAGAAQGGQAQGTLEVFLAAARFFNQDAPAAGLAKAALPGA